MAMQLYQRIIGPAWPELHEPVRRFHLTNGEMHGLFDVQWGKSRFARWLTQLLRLPEAGKSLPTRLVVTPQGDGERWWRTFGTSDFITEQRELAGQLLEYSGPIQFLFQLEVVDGALVYYHRRSALRLGRLAAPLPRHLSLRIEAREWGRSDEPRVHGWVRVTAPLVGLLISYEGYIEISGAS